MTNEAKLIEEAVKKCPFIQKHIDEQFIGLQSAIWGIKSESAKLYHTKDMYSEKEVKDLCSKAIWDYIHSNGSTEAPMYGTDYHTGVSCSKKSHKQCNITKWFERNKKK